MHRYWRTRTNIGADRHIERDRLNSDRSLLCFIKQYRQTATDNWRLSASPLRRQHHRQRQHHCISAHHRSDSIITELSGINCARRHHSDSITPHCITTALSDNTVINGNSIE
jgi:hypothetical protein